MNDKNNVLIVSENGQKQVYDLDDRAYWEVGRPFGDNNPDIKLNVSTVSRKHGSFQNIDGIWFYLDKNKKNGTAYNGRRITAGINGRIKPIMLKDGDELVFGCGSRGVKNEKTATAKYIMNE